MQRHGQLQSGDENESGRSQNTFRLPNLAIMHGLSTITSSTALAWPFPYRIRASVLRLFPTLSILLGSVSQFHPQTYELSTIDARDDVCLPLGDGPLEALARPRLIEPRCRRSRPFAAKLPRDRALLARSPAGVLVDADGVLVGTSDGRPT